MQTRNGLHNARSPRAFSMETSQWRRTKPAQAPLLLLQIIRSLQFKSVKCSIRSRQTYTFTPLTI